MGQGQAFPWVAGHLEVSQQPRPLPPDPPWGQLGRGLPVAAADEAGEGGGAAKPDPGAGTLALAQTHRLCPSRSPIAPRALTPGDSHQGRGGGEKCQLSPTAFPSSPSGRGASACHRLWGPRGNPGWSPGWSRAKTLPQIRSQGLHPPPNRTWAELTPGRAFSTPAKPLCRVCRAGLWRAWASPRARQGHCWVQRVPFLSCPALYLAEPVLEVWFGRRHPGSPRKSRAKHSIGIGAPGTPGAAGPPSRAQ